MWGKTFIGHLFGSMALMLCQTDYHAFQDVLSKPRSNTSQLNAEHVSDSSTRTNIGLRGQVTDSNGEPIAGASVWISPDTNNAVIVCNELWDEYPVTFCKTDAEGRYSFELTRQQPSLLATVDFQLAVSAPGSAIFSRTILCSRLRCDVPYDVTLDTVEAIDISVLGPDGETIYGVDLVPANLSGGRIPHPIAWQFPIATSDEAGVARLQQVQLKSLKCVYAKHADFGYQRLPVVTSLNEAGRKQHTVQLRRTETLRGGFVFQSEQDREHASNFDFSKLRMLIGTFEEGSNPARNEMDWVTYSTIDINPDRTFVVNNLTQGQLQYHFSCDGEFPFRELFRQNGITFKFPKDDEQIEFELVRSPRIVATILGGKSKQPLAGILLHTYDGRLESIVTDETGHATFFRTFDGLHYFPFDPFGNYFRLDPFSIYTDNLPDNHEIKLETLVMTESVDQIWKTVDTDGNPIAGAKVDYNFSSERFQLTDSVFSNSDGTFRFAKSLPSMAIEVSASAGGMASDIQSITLGNGTNSIIELSSRTSVKPSGVIVDEDGAPLGGVKVALKKGHEMIKESYDRRMLIAQDFYESGSTVISDNEGRFEFPETIDLQSQMQIHILEPGYLDHFSPFINPAEHDVVEGQLDLGTFKLTRVQAEREKTVIVVDSEDSPITNAKFVIVGARIGRHRGVTDNRGQTVLTFGDGEAVYAIETEEGKFCFGSVSIDDEHVVLHFEPRPFNPHPPAHLSREVIDFSLNRLLESSEAPDLEQANFYRKQIYLMAIASADPERFQNLWKADVEGPNSKSELFKYTNDPIVEMNPRLLFEDWINKLDIRYRRYMYMSAANHTMEQQVRDELISEAIVCARSLKGQDKVAGLSYVISNLLYSGEGQLAKELAAELWESAGMAQDILTAGKRQPEIRTARVVAPSLALIDLEKALRLIELTASENELGSLKSEAVLKWEQLHPEEFRQQFDTRHTDWFDAEEGVDPVMFTPGLEHYHRWLKLDLSNAELILSHVKNLEKRIKLLLVYARCASEDQRQDLFKQLRHSFKQFEQTSHAEYSYWQRELFSSLQVKGIWNDEQRRAITFDALWYLPEKFESKSSMLIYAPTAKILSLEEPALAKTMLLPKIESRGWMFSPYNRLMPFRDPVFNALPWIDPVWAADVADELANQEFRYYLPDRLETSAGMIEHLRALRDYLYPSQERR